MLGLSHPLPSPEKIYLTGRLWDKELALQLDGVAMYGDIDAIAPQMATVTGMTHSMWLKVNGTDAANRMTLGVNTSAGGNRVLFLIGGTQNYLSILNSGGSSIVSTRHKTTNLTDNAWHHIAWSRDASHVYRIYIDGSIEITSSVYNAGLAADDTWSIGMEYDGAAKGDFLDGTVKDYAVWERVLSADELTAVYNNGLPTDLGSMTDDLCPAEFFHSGDREVIWATGMYNTGWRGSAGTWVNADGGDLVASGL